MYCCQLFKKNLGKTFSEYVAELRIRKARGLLQQTDLSIESIAIQSGYVDYYYFNKVFKKHCGMTPAKFRKKGKLNGAAGHEDPQGEIEASAMVVLLLLYCYIHCDGILLLL
ncbi:helix-turn-helix domain-containing protein [Paenibacillus rhizoplanae]